MTDIKVLSRDALTKLVDGLPIEIISKDQCRSSGTPFFRSDVIERINDENDGAANRLGWRIIVALMDEYQEPAKWEPGTVLSYKHDPNWTIILKAHGSDIAGCRGWTVIDARDGKENSFNLEPSHWSIHRLPHEFKVGDWAEQMEGIGRGHIFEVKKVSEGEPFLYDSAYWFNASICRHVPPPPEGKPAYQDNLFQAANTAALNLQTSMNLGDHPKSCLCYGCGLSRAVVDYALNSAQENVRPIVLKEREGELPPNVPTSFKTTEKPASPWTGPQWDEENFTKDIVFNAWRRDRDLADEIDKLAGRK